jgi:hypothetical protein
MYMYSPFQKNTALISWLKKILSNFYDWFCKSCDKIMDNLVTNNVTFQVQRVLDSLFSSKIEHVVPKLNEILNMFKKTFIFI